eukprot:2168512-Pyramimonas_sp.AAC.1
MNGGKRLCEHGVAAATLLPDRAMELLQLWTHKPTPLRTKFTSESPSKDIWFHLVLVSSGNASTRTSASPQRNLTRLLEK